MRTITFLGFLLCTLTSLPTVSDKYCYHAHFTDRKTKAQRKNPPRVTGPVIEAGLKLRQSGSRT